MIVYRCHACEVPSPCMYSSQSYSPHTNLHGNVHATDVWDGASERAINRKEASTNAPKDATLMAFLVKKVMGIVRSTTGNILPTAMYAELSAALGEQLPIEIAAFNSASDAPHQECTGFQDSMESSGTFAALLWYWHRHRLMK